MAAPPDVLGGTDENQARSVRLLATFVGIEEDLEGEVLLPGFVSHAAFCSFAINGSRFDGAGAKAPEAAEGVVRQYEQRGSLPRYPVGHPRTPSEHAL